MSKNKIEVIGILINTELKDFKLYHQQVEKTSCGLSSSSTSAEGLENIKEILASSDHASSEFVIVCDDSCPMKEAHIKTVLALIKENNLKPSLFLIGNKDLVLSEEITQKLSFTHIAPYTQEPFELLKSSVKDKLDLAHKTKQFLSCFEKNKTAFNSQLAVLAKKAKQLRKDKQFTAADAAERLHQELTKKADAYFANPTEEAYSTFKKHSKADIEQAHKELDKHRGCKRVLGNIGLAILGFGILYFVAIAIHKNLFFNKTDSSKKLDQFAKLIDADTFRMK
jgi:hypothetical protein